MTAPVEQQARDSYLIGTRPIDHGQCVQGKSGAWYPNFGAGVEIFGWAHNHEAVHGV